MFFTCLIAATLLAAPALAPAPDKDKEAKTVLQIEDNMGFVGPAMNFELKSDGAWTLSRRFPPAERGEHKGKLTEKEVESLLADLKKAGAFDEKSKDIEPENPQLRDGAYFAVTQPARGKLGKLKFTHGGATANAIRARLAKLAPAKAEQ